MSVSCMSGCEDPSSVALLPRVRQLSPTSPISVSSTASSMISRSSVSGLRHMRATRPRSFGAARISASPASRAARSRCSTRLILGCTPVTPRIPPGTRAQTGVVNALITRVIGLAGGTAGPPGLFATLGRHRRLFRPWLRFASRLMPGGKLPRRDAELVILRVSVLCDSPYEWGHHERIAQRFGLDRAAIERARVGPDADGWDQRQAAIL